MPVISFVSSKGGVGKTTGAVILAGELAEAGRSVVMVDADPNQPLLIWKKVRAVPPAISIVADESADTIIDTIDAARGRADFVIVVTRTDLVLIPVQASVLDATEAAKAVKLVRQMSRVTGRDIPYRLYFSKTAPAIRERTARDIEEQFTQASVPTLPASLVDRAAFRSLFSLGGTLHMLDNSDVGGLEAARQNAFAFAQAIADTFSRRAAA
jgi:chromosome partitioning protein